MNIVDQEGSLALADVLSKPLFAHLATVERDLSRVSPVWFLWEDNVVWMLGATDSDTFPRRVKEHPQCAVSIVDYDAASGRVHHVGMRGHATVEPFDLDRAVRKLSKYLGADRSRWDSSRFALRRTERLCFVRFVPDTVVVRDQSYAVTAT